MKKRIKYSIGREPNVVILAWECEACNGNGRIGDVLPPKHCSTCDGFGFLTTEDGASILALVHDVYLKAKRYKA